MKRVEFETKINIDAKIGDKSVNENLIDKEDYASAFRLLEDKIEVLEGTLCNILDYLED